MGIPSSEAKIGGIEIPAQVGTSNPFPKYQGVITTVADAAVIIDAVIMDGVLTTAALKVVDVVIKAAIKCVIAFPTIQAGATR